MRYNRNELYGELSARTYQLRTLSSRIAEIIDHLRRQDSDTNKKRQMYVRSARYSELHTNVLELNTISNTVTELVQLLRYALLADCPDKLTKDCDVLIDSDEHRRLQENVDGLCAEGESYVRSSRR